MTDLNRPLYSLTIAEYINLNDQLFQKNLTAIKPAPPTEQADQWFDLDGLCAYLPGKPVKSTVYSWTSNHTIPFHRKGKALAFLRSEIDLWIKSSRHRTREEIALEADKFLNKK